MHEAGIAASIAAALREYGSSWRQGRILVRGGHPDSAAFDQALWLHLQAEGAPSELKRLTIVHLPVDLRCSRCNAAYVASDQTASCPTCGGAPLPASFDEMVELELDP
jgi:Zn finger protein HypA/HybF involved in hydrogenase expression